MGMVKEFSLSLYGVAGQSLTVSTGSAIQSAPVSDPQSASVDVIIGTTTDVYLLAGSSPTASSTAGRLVPAGSLIRTVLVSGHRISALAVSSPGVVFVAAEV